MKRGDEAVVFSSHFTHVTSLDPCVPDPIEAEVNGTIVVLLTEIPLRHGRRWKCAPESRERFLDIHEAALHVTKEGTERDALLAETETTMIAPIMLR